MNGNPIWPPISGKAVTMLGAADPLPTLSKPVSPLEEAMQSPGVQESPCDGAWLFPITPKPECAPPPCFPRATPQHLGVRGEGAQFGLCGKDEGSAS